MAGRRLLMPNQDNYEKKIFLMVTGVMIIFLVFILVDNILSRKTTTEPVGHPKKENTRFSSPPETRESPVEENKIFFVPPAQNVSNSQLKHKDLQKDADKKIIYEFPLTEKILVQ